MQCLCIRVMCDTCAHVTAFSGHPISEDGGSVFSIKNVLLTRFFSVVIIEPVVFLTDPKY